MANHDGLPTGALLLGGGLAGYALGHWLIAQRDDPAPVPAPTSTSSSTPPLDEPVSSPSRNGRASTRYTREGRTILRDGVAVVRIERVDLGDQRYAITPHETDRLTEEIVALLDGRRAPRRRDGRAKDPRYQQRWLVDDRCGYRAWLFSTSKPPAEAVVGDVWGHIEKPSGEIVGKRRFRTTDEAYRYVKAALKRALERAGKFDCY